MTDKQASKSTLEELQEAVKALQKQVQEQDRIISDLIRRLWILEGRPSWRENDFYQPYQDRIV